MEKDKNKKENKPTTMKGSPVSYGFALVALVAFVPFSSALYAAISLKSTPYAVHAVVSISKTFIHYLGGNYYIT
ncbi:hypothetical protein cypCar_00045387 [Cyprinus carpio]|nr:hypothetical protein cypCar_00045387 [Cyprinus carpio]